LLIWQNAANGQAPLAAKQGQLLMNDHIAGAYEQLRLCWWLKL